MEIEFAQQKLESLRKQAIYLFIGAAIAFVFGIVIVFKSLNVITTSIKLLKQSASSFFPMQGPAKTTLISSP